MATSDGSATTWTMGNFNTTTDASGITWDPGSFHSHYNSNPLVPNVLPSVCETMGHVVEKWAEYLDGECVATCAVCMQRVTAYRMAGGMPFMRLKALVEQLIATPDAAELYLEINEVSDLLDAEERALQDARALLRTARQMAGCDES